MRHNRAMRSVAVAAASPGRPGSILLPVVLALAACQRQSPPPDATAVQLPSGAHDSLQWRGTRPCVDCRDIQVQLVLFRGHGDTYALTETYRTPTRAARFVERGRWQREGARLQLRGDRGSLRRYALLADGRLQPRDLRGGAWPAGDTLQPVADVTP